MELTKQFHEMEVKYNLFDLGKEDNFPIWDIVRYNIYVKFYYPKKNRKLQELKKKRNAYYFIKLFFKVIKIVFVLISKRAKYIFFTSSRYKNHKNKYFDKSADSLFEFCKKEAIAVDKTFNNNIKYSNIYDIYFIFKSVLNIKKNHENKLGDYFIKINYALYNTFNEIPITEQELKNIIHNYFSKYKFYYYLFKIKKTNKIFISKGNPKAEISAAKKLGMITYLLQHASIEFDEIDYSYPEGINRKSNILYPDVLLTFGDYWGEGINIPAEKIIAIGNDYFYSKPQTEEDNTILVVSSIVHGTELIELTKELASYKINLAIIYKLHPNEFHCYERYKKIFRKYNNVRIVKNEEDTNILISKCQLVILIVSAVLYEALNQNKKVAVYKKMNYKRNLKFEKYPNVFFFDNANELDSILQVETQNQSLSFFKPFNKDFISEIL